MEGGELKDGEGKRGNEKEREGNNVLPHFKRAVAAYDAGLTVSISLTGT